MSDDLNSLVQGSELCFGGLIKNRKFLGSCKHLVEVLACRSKAENIFDRNTRLKNVQHELIGEVDKLHD